MPTLEEMRNRLISIVDTNNSTHVSESEYNAILASAAAETYDKIIDSGTLDLSVKSTTITTVSGTLDYDLTAIGNVPDQDFYKVFQLYVDEGSGQMRPLPRINHAEIQAFRPPQTTVTTKLYYIPKAPTFKNVDGSWNDAANFDAINGWEEHTLMLAEITIRAKREEDYSKAFARKQELEARISRMAKQDFSEPTRVVRRRRRYQDPFMLFRNNINAWSIRGHFLQLYYHYGYIP